MIKNVLVYGLFIIAGLLLTFFGLGPVLFADGSTSERLITLAVVVLFYVILGVLLKVYRNKVKKS